MQRYPVIALLLALAVGLFGFSGPVNAQEMDPAAVIEAVYNAVSANDIEGAVALLADDAVLTLVPPPAGLDGTFVGKEEIGAWFEGLAADNVRYEFSDVMTNGDMATMTLVSYDDFFDNVVGGPAEFDGVAVVQDGLWKSVSWVFTPEFVEKFDAAMAHQASSALVDRYFAELWNEGNLDVVDEIIAEDFVSHSYPMIDGDRDALRESVSGFRAENPNAYFTFDDVTVADGRAFVINTMMVRPAGAATDTEGEPASSPMVLVLGIEDGKITDRWLYLHAE